MTNIENDPAHLQAAEWLVRLQGAGATREDTLAWQRWLAESQVNARAYAHIEALSHVLRTVPAPPAVSTRQLARDRYDASVPLKDWREPHLLSRSWPVITLAASLAAIALTLTLWKSASPVLLSTVIGENRTVLLNDGSKVALGGDTRLEVILSKERRLLTLTRGEALFTVAKDSARPFKVRAGDATIVALGTAFNVRRSRDRAVVSVTEGRVRVEPAGGVLPITILGGFKPKLHAVDLNAGQQTTAGSAGIEAPVAVENLAATTAWRTGRLAFRLQPLRDVLDDVNRYARKPIVLDGEGMGELVFTGTVTPDHIDGWIDSLQRAFALEAVEEPERIVLRARH